MAKASQPLALQKKILVIDDDPGVLVLVATVLEAEGFSVQTARTSKMALQRARACEFDLILLDLMLPDADGVILHGKLKNLFPGIESRTIFMTGFTSQEPVIAYLESLGAGFLHKPFLPVDLVRAVAKLT
jgi:DNA-binding response OmpR family regulator